MASMQRLLMMFQWMGIDLHDINGRNTSTFEIFVGLEARDQSQGVASSSTT